MHYDEYVPDCLDNGHQTVIGAVFRGPTGFVHVRMQ